MRKIYTTLLAGAAVVCTSQSMMAEHPDPITKAPEGRTVEYVKAGWSYSTANYNKIFGLVEGKTGKAVWTDDNEVYFSDFMLSYTTEYYVKGRVEGNQVIVDFPQTVTSFDWGNGVDWNMVQLLKKVAEPENEGDFPNFKVVTENNRIVFDIIDGETLLMKQTDNSYIVGVTDESGNWNWNGEYGCTWAPFQDGDKTITPPETATFENNWEILASGDTKQVSVAFDGDDFYVQGFSKYLPEAWIKGTADGDKMTFLSGQYMGRDQEYNHTDFMIAATLEEVNGEYLFVRADEIVFDYDKENRTLSSKGNILVNTNNTDYIRYLEAFQQPIIRPKRTQTESYVPANPIISAWNDPDPIFTNLASLVFELPRLSVENDILDVSNLYYRIYTGDGDLFTFYPDEYEILTVPTEDIPYTLNDRKDFISNGTYHSVYFQFHGIDRIGVQSVYKNGTEEFASDIIYNTTSAVEAVEADTVSTEYFDLQGRRVANPEKGIYVERQHKADGSVISRKVARF